jgi:hypothetical protein
MNPKRRKVVTIEKDIAKNRLQLLIGIPGVIEFIFGFLMEKILVGYYHRGSHGVSFYRRNLAIYLHMSRISHQFHKISHRLGQFMFLPIYSLDQLDKPLVARAGAIDLLGNIIVPMYSLTLKMMELGSDYAIPGQKMHKKNVVILDPSHIRTWCIPHLESLSLHSIVLTESGLVTIFNQFLNLKYLFVHIKSSKDFSISNSIMLITLVLSVITNYEDESSENRMKLCIENMPSLAIISISGDIDTLETRGLNQLKTIRLSDDLEITNVIFNDSVPNLNNLNLGLGTLSIIDPHRQVLWQKVKKIRLLFTKNSKEICKQLKDVESVNLYDEENDDIRDVPWNMFQRLVKLRLFWPRFNILPSITSNLELFHLDWDSQFVLDLRILAKFPNLLYIYLHNQEDDMYTHFEALLQLPKHPKIICKLTITANETLLLQGYNERFLENFNNE